MSFTLSTNLAPWRISRCVPRLRLAPASPGTAKTSRPCSRAREAVISEPLFFLASTTGRPRRGGPGGEPPPHSAAVFAGAARTDDGDRLFIIGAKAAFDVKKR